MNRIAILSDTIVIVSLIFLLGIVPVSAQENGGCVDGQAFIKIKEGVQMNISYNPLNGIAQRNSELEYLINKYDIYEISNPFIRDYPALQRIYRVLFPAVINTQTLLKEFDQLPFIEFAEPVPNYELFLTPNDLHVNQWYLPKILAESAWDLNTGLSSTVIAIVDDAVLLTHEDLASVIWTNLGETPGNGIDDDNNGYIDDINGWDAADNDNDPNPVNPTNSYFTHGTHCAGIAAASTDNNIGIASISYNVQVMAVKTGFDGNGSLPAAYLGVEYAIAAQADIISMSWGGAGYSQTYQILFDLAYNNGIVLIAAAGNSNTTIPMYPASYNHVISVAATDINDQKASFSNYGNSVDVAAPGKDIWSCLAGSTSSYDYLSGTSMACPLVSGLAALMLSRDPSLTPDALEACLKSACDNIDVQNPNYIGQLGAGRINAYKALQCLKPISADFTSNFIAVCPGDTVIFTDLTTNSPFAWNWTFPGGSPTSSTQENPVVVYNALGTYDVTLIATNTDSTDTITKTSYITVAYPTAIISGSATIPAGFSANLRIDLTGSAPWTITYSDGTGNFTVPNIMNSPYYIVVSPDSTTTYSLTAVTGNGCAGSIAGAATIQITIPPSSPGCMDLDSVLFAYDHYSQDSIFYIDPISGAITGVGNNTNDDWVAMAYDTLNKIVYGFSNIVQPRSLWAFDLVADTSILIYTYTNLNFFAAAYDNASQKLYAVGFADAANSPQFLYEINTSTGLETNIGGLGLLADKSTYNALDDGINGLAYDPGLNVLYGISHNRDLYSISTSSGAATLLGNTGTFNVRGLTYDFNLDVLYGINQTETVYIFNKNNGNVISSIPAAGSFTWITSLTYVPNYCPSGFTGSACSPTFQKSFGGVDWDYAYHIEKTSDGGYILAGWTQSFGAGNKDCYLVKTNVDGDVMWTRTFGGPDDEYCFAVKQTFDGGYILGGQTKSFGSGVNTIYIIKTDANGNAVWTKTYGGTGNDQVTEIGLVNDGGYIISGMTNSYGAGGSGSDMYLIRIDSLGGVVWAKTYGGTSSDWAMSCQQTDDGGFIVLGTTVGFGAGSSAVYLVKVNINGDTLWSRTYGGNAMDEGRSIYQTVDGGYVMIGNSTSFGLGGNDFYVVRTDGNGDIIWTKAYGGALEDWGISVVETTDGGFIFAGRTASFGAGGYDSYLIKTDASGDTLWTKTYGGTAVEEATAIVQANDGGYVLSGYEVSFGAGGVDMFMVKTDEDGNSGCNQLNTNTSVINTTTIVTSTNTIVGSGVTVTNPATVTTNPPSIASVACVDCDSVVTPPLSLNCIVAANFTTDTVCALDSTSFQDQSVDLFNNIVIWQWYFGDGDSLLGVQNPKHVYQASGTYSVTLIIANDSIPTCFDTTTKSVTVIDTLTVFASPGDSICMGDSIELGIEGMLCGTPPFLYNWTPTTGLDDSSSSNPKASPVVLTIYTVTVTDSTGAISSDIQTIYVDTSCCTSYALFSKNPWYCYGDSVYFTNNSVATGGANYTWDFGSKATPGSFTGIDPPPVYFDSVGVIKVLLILSDSCGLDSTYGDVNIFPLPEAKAGEDTALCALDTVGLGSIPISGLGYLWQPGYNISDTSIANPMISPDSSILYMLIVTDDVSGCMNTDSVQITITPPVLADAGADLEICLGDSVQLNASGGSVYSWTPGLGLSDSTIDNPMASPIANIMYQVIVSTGNCVPDSDSISINVNNLPIVDAGVDITIAIGESVQLSGSGASSYQWSPATGLSCVTCTSPMASPDNSTVYILTGVDADGCMDIDTVIVSVDNTISIFVPDIFSPNDDGENDILFIQGKGVDYLDLLIFDRWGEKLFEMQDFSANDLTSGWDGTYKGAKVGPGVYVYLLKGKFINGTTIYQKGDITVIR